LPFRLPGGEKAVSEPRRSAIGVLFEAFGVIALNNEQFEPIRSFSARERRILVQMLTRNLNAPYTSSVGRLFDATASLLGLVQRTTFEGQAAMALEFSLDESFPSRRYDCTVEASKDVADNPLILDWRPMIQALLDDIARGAATSHMAAAFHNGLVEAIATVAKHIGIPTVVLTGGCFQNKYLAEAVVKRLLQERFEPVWHQHVPPNDGGLALGQAVWAARLLQHGVT
jgi:hydrogenase maturation protein HypF